MGSEMCIRDSLKIVDPLEELPLASSKDYGDYAARKKELLMKGRRWFWSLAENWGSKPWVKEFKKGSLEVYFADGKSFSYGSTRVRFSKPLFHGLEYDRLGWVLMLTVEHGGVKVIHSSDLQGPVIEDYAEMVIDEDPDVLVLDGPPTYLFGYTLNKINLRRAEENVKRILDESEVKLVIYDHHLPRGRLFKHRLERLYSSASSERLMTAAEWLGEQPLILKITGQS